MAHLASQAEVLAYEADVFARIEAWLATLNDADLDRVPDVLARARDYPAERVTPAYLHELADQVEWNVARFLTSPCIGHQRGHCGELELQLELLHAAHG